MKMIKWNSKGKKQKELKHTHRSGKKLPKLKGMHRK